MSTAAIREIVCEGKGAQSKGVVVNIDRAPSKLPLLKLALNTNGGRIQWRALPGQEIFAVHEQPVLFDVPIDVYVSVAYLDWSTKQLACWHPNSLPIPLAINASTLP